MYLKKNRILYNLIIKKINNNTQERKMVMENENKNLIVEDGKVIDTSTGEIISDDKAVTGITRAKADINPKTESKKEEKKKPKAEVKTEEKKTADKPEINADDEADKEKKNKDTGEDVEFNEDKLPVTAVRFNVIAWKTLSPKKLARNKKWLNAGKAYSDAMKALENGAVKAEIKAWDKETATGAQCLGIVFRKSIGA